MILLSAIGDTMDLHLIQSFDVKTEPLAIESAKSLNKVKPSRNRKTLNANHSRKEAPLQFVCDVQNCKWAFPTKSRLDRHSQVHYSEKCFPCKFAGCKKAFKTKFNLKFHCKKIHETEATFKCDIEGCNSAFHNRIGLDVHRATHASAQPAYRCGVNNCVKAFFTHSALCSHMRRHDTSDEHLTCSICDKVFDAPCRLRAHMTTHGEKSFRCSVEGCSWGFFTASKLKRHMLHHNQIRDFACSSPGCTKTFLRRQHLADHEKVHHRRLKCPDVSCGQVFDIKKEVRSHMDSVHCKNDLLPVQHSKKSKVKSPNRQRTPFASANSSPNVASLGSSFVRGKNMRSARTSLTYSDVVVEKQAKGSVDVSRVSSTYVPDEKDNSVNNVINCGIQQIDGVNLQEEELLPHIPDYLEVLMLESSRLEKLEPSTINLRDLQ